LSLREDNADMRLTELGRELGLVDDTRWRIFEQKREAVSRETQRLATSWVTPQSLPTEAAVALLGKAIDHEYSLAELLRRPEVSYRSLMASQDGALRPSNSLADDAVTLAQIEEQVEISIKYQGYIDRQAGEIVRNESHEGTRLPADIDYKEVRGLSFEACQKLNAHRPETIGQASRMSGMTPAAISLLMVHLKKRSLRRAGVVDVGEGTASETSSDAAATEGLGGQ
jgi:tRNA uridine 5-carboxymethylaminomethyl modification enzyme